MDEIINIICITVCICIFILSYFYFDYKKVESRHAILHSFAQANTSCEEIMKFVSENY